MSTTQPTPALKPLAVDVRTAARLLATTPATVYRMAERGDLSLTRLPGTRRTVILMTEVERVLGIVAEAA